MPEDVFVYLGQCLRDAREECGLTQQELADQTGRGLRHLQDIEKGRVGDIPRHLKNVHADSAGSERPQAYKYPHIYPKHYVKQRYLPESLGDTTYYEYADNKTEQAAKHYWDLIKGGGE